MGRADIATRRNGRRALVPSSAGGSGGGSGDMDIMLAPTVLPTSPAATSTASQPEAAAGPAVPAPIPARALAARPLPPHDSAGFQCEVLLNAGAVVVLLAAPVASELPLPGSPDHP